MRLDILNAIALPTLAALATAGLALSPPAFADDDGDVDDMWEDDEDCDDEDEEEDDEEYQSSLFDSPTYTWSTQQAQITYDAEGAPGRRINVLAYLSDAPGERPVVVVSHGGGNGRSNPATVLPAWTRYLADHGYNVLAVAHPPRTNTQKLALCNFFQFPISQCGGTLAWDRTQDIEQVLDLLDAQAAGPWAGVVDTDRVGLVGYSAGATGALMVGGATRQFGVQLQDNPDDRVSVIVAASPARLLPDKGLVEGSWSTVAVPTLVLTGSRDVSVQAQPAGFGTDAFDGLPEEEENYLLYLNSAGSFHGLFALNGVACRAAVGDEECRELSDAQQSTVLAHLDQHLLDDNTAKDWLEDEVVDEVVTAGLVDLTSREDLEDED